MSLYFAQAGDGGPIKIGVTNGDVRRRIHYIQNSSPVRVRLLAVAEGGRDEEKAIHSRFRVHRRHGEWFDPHPELVSYITTLGPPPLTMQQARRQAAREGDAGRLWFDLSIPTDLDAAQRASESVATLKAWLGPSGRPRRMTSEQARKYGAMGNEALAAAREWFPSPDDIAKALPIWQNTTTYPRTTDALAAMDDRWSEKTAYRKLGRRWPSLPLGRPKGK